MRLGRPSPALLRSIVREKPLEGRLLKEWWGGVAESTQAKVLAALNRGLVNGDMQEAIVRAIKGRKRNGYAAGLHEAPRRHVQAVVQTATNHVSSRA